MTNSENLKKLIFSIFLSKFKEKNAKNSLSIKIKIPGCDSEGFLPSYYAAEMGRKLCRAPPDGVLAGSGRWFSGRCFGIRKTF